METYLVIDWPKPLFEFTEFVAAFLAAGAVGFRYTSLRGRLGAAGEATPYRRMARRAAVLGLLGAAYGVWHVWEVLPRIAARSQVTVGQLLSTPNVGSAWFVLSLLAVVGYALALAGRGAGWHLAALGVVAGGLRYLFVGDLRRVVAPAHLLAGGLWIGTLFVLVVAGLAVALRDESAAERRGAVVADIVHAFSPLALASGASVVLLGAIAAWRELGGELRLLWTTPYGYALLAKLCVVAAVFALGAWNWRRQRPALGTERSALALRRSARAELVAAALVVAITSIMLSLPSPDTPRPAAGTAAGPAR